MSKDLSDTSTSVDGEQKQVCANENTPCEKSVSVEVSVAPQYGDHQDGDSQEVDSLAVPTPVGPVPVEVIFEDSDEPEVTVEEVEVISEVTEVAAKETEVTAEQTEVAADEITVTAEQTEVTAEQTEVNAEEAKESPDSELEQQDTEQSAPSSGFARLAEIGLSPAVLKSIEDAGYENPSPIQSETVPFILEGRDLMGQAETGSGKTAAFAWPILSNINFKLAKPQVLVLAPTRELAIQVTRAFEKYASSIPEFRAVTIYGGQSYDTQLRALRRGVHVVVGTPGRMMDHLRRKTLDLSALTTVVLDEADEMLRMGFIDDVEWILEQVPKKRQVLLFSATLPAEIQRIARTHLNSPAHVAIQSNSATADSIAQSCLVVHAREKVERLIRLLETEETDGVLVFVKTRNTTVNVAERLIQRGFIASALNGDIPQTQRERSVNQLKSGRINVLVATDVAARGLDVKRISHVINFDFPHDTEAYVHRIGRTGRAGRTGNAILFVEPKEKGKLSRLQRATNQNIATFKQKSIDEINMARVQKFKERIVSSIGDKQIKFFSQMISDFQNEAELPFAEIAGALAIMAQGDSPLLLKELAQSKSNWKREDAPRGGGREKRDHGSMTTYRVEVGRSHGVGPGNLVGAITNEADLNNSHIGRINIFDAFSTIDLPSSLSSDVIDLLRDVHVSGQRLSISKSDRTYAKSGGRRSSPSHDRGGHGGGRSAGGRSGNKRFGDSPRSYSGGNKSRSGSSYRPNDSSRQSSGGETSGSQKSDFGNNRAPSTSRDQGSSGKFEKKSYSDRKGSDRKGSDRTGTNDRYKSSNSRSSSGEHSGGGRETSGNYKPSGDRGATSQQTSSGNYKPSGDRRSKPTVKKASVTKTRAAERTKAKRKPGAKPSGPMKKYVKIRAR